MYEPSEPVTHSSLNCFGVSSGSTVLEVKCVLYNNIKLNWSLSSLERRLWTPLPPSSSLHFLSSLLLRLSPGERSHVGTEGENILQVEGEVLHSNQRLSPVF